MAVRLLHFSDIHLPPRNMGWQVRDFFSKCLSGWVNMRLLGRARRFKHAIPALEQLFKVIDTTQPDGVLFSGDATHMAFESEFLRVAQVLQTSDRVNGDIQYVAVPGNHDYYTQHAIRQTRFERHFANWQTGVRVHLDAYPFARNIKGIWIIALNSCTANSTPFDATGRIGPEQLQRLRELNQQLGPGLRIILTHYPLRQSAGLLEHRLRRLRDHAAAMEAAQEIGAALWLHGHIHTPFYLPRNEPLPFATICNGSTGMTNRWSYHEYTIEDRHLRAKRHVYSPRTGKFSEVQNFEMQL